MRVLFWCLLLCLPAVVTAQVQLTLNQPPVNRLQVEDLWQVSLNNPTGEEGEVWLYAEVKQQGKVVAYFRSTPFPLRSGLQHINPQHIQASQRKFLDGEAQRIYSMTNVFPSGSYAICVQLLRAWDESVWDENCVEHTVINSTQKMGKKQAPIKKLADKVQFYGNGYVEGYYANRQGALQTLPQQYVRMELQPTLQFATVPVGVRAFYTTENVSHRASMNGITLLFDEEQFKSNLRALVTDRVLQDENIRQLSAIGDLENLRKLERLETLADDKSLQKQFEELRDIDEIEKQLENSDLVGIVEQIDQGYKNIKHKKESFHYRAKKQLLEEQIEIQRIRQQAGDSLRAQQQIDHLEEELNTLELLKDSVNNAVARENETIEKLKERKQQFNELKSRYEQLKSLQKKKEQFDRLMAEGDKLRQLRDKLEADGRLEDLQQFDLNTLKDPEVLKSSLKEYDLFSGERKFFFGFSRLAVGTTFPYYSPLVLNGIQVTGGELAMNPGNFYMGVTAGRSARSYAFNDTLGHVYEQNLVAGRIGLGKPQKTHFFLTALRTVEVPESVSLPETAGGNPQSNTVLGAEFQLSLFNRAVLLKAEGAGSKLDMNNQLEPVDLGSDIPGAGLPGFLQPTLGSRYGLAYDIKAQFTLFKNRTRFTAGTRTIDPNYTSVGSPFLRTDIQRYELTAEQYMLERQIRLGGDYRLDRNNLLWNQEEGMEAEYLRAHLALNVRKLPFVRFQLIRQSQQSPGRSFEAQNIFATTGHNYNIGTLRLTTNLNYTYQAGGKPDSFGYSDTLGDYTIQQYMLTQTVNFRIPLSFSVNAGYTQASSTYEDYELLNLNAMSSVTLFQKLTSSVGVRLTRRFGQSSMVGFFGELNYPFLQYFSFGLRVNNRYYDHLLSPTQNFDELFGRARLTVNW